MPGERIADLLYAEWSAALLSMFDATPEYAIECEEFLALQHDDVGLVNEGGGVESVPGVFVREPGRREPAEFIYTGGNIPAAAAGSVFTISPPAAGKASHVIHRSWQACS